MPERVTGRQVPAPCSVLQEDVGWDGRGAQSSEEGAGTKGSLICPHAHFSLSSPCSVHPNTHACACTHGSAHVHQPRHTRTLTYTHTSTHLCKHACTHERTHVHTCPCSHMHVHAFTQCSHPRTRARGQTTGSRRVCSRPRTCGAGVTDGASRHDVRALQAGSVTDEGIDRSDLGVLCMAAF